MTLSIRSFQPSRIRALFEEQGFLIQEWDKVRTDWLTIRENFPRAGAEKVALVEAARI